MKSISKGLRAAFALALAGCGMPQGTPANVQVASAQHATAASGVSFSFDWAKLGVPNCNVGSNLADNWQSVQTMNDARNRLEPFATSLGGVRARLSDKSSVRVRVFAGDNTCGFDSGERAEAAAMIDVDDRLVNEAAHVGSTLYYAFSVYVPSGFAPATKRGYPWGIVLQLHGPDEYHASPDLAFGLEGGTGATLEPPKHPTIVQCPVRSAIVNASGHATVAYNVGYNGGDVSPSGARHQIPTTCYLSRDARPAFDRWTDFVLAVTWAGTPSGGFTVYRRDAGTRAFDEVLHVKNVATLQYDPAVDGSSAQHLKGVHYWKQGLYRAISRHTDTVYLSGITRANSMGAAEAAAFETSASEH